MRIITILSLSLLIFMTSCSKKTPSKLVDTPVLKKSEPQSTEATKQQVVEHADHGYQAKADSAHNHEEHSHDHAHGHDHSAHEAKKPGVYFVGIKNGSKLRLPNKITFEVVGMTVKKAGTMDMETGHHHLIVDGAFVPKGKIVKNNKTHIHFGKGQSSFLLDGLSPGQHTLTLQFANGLHVSYGEAWSRSIQVNVVE